MPELLWRVQITQVLFLPAVDRAEARRIAETMVTDEFIMRSEHEMDPPKIAVAFRGFEIDTEDWDRARWDDTVEDAQCG